MTTISHRAVVLTDEWLLVRHSGEIPEIALHSALYYLTEDRDGPQLQLTSEEIASLQEAASARYQEIIFRDLNYENRTLSGYRGIKRAIFNWNRFSAFRQRQGKHNTPSFREDVAQALLALLLVVATADEETPGGDDSRLPFILNCTSDELIRFTDDLGIPPEKIPTRILHLCHR